MPSPRPPTLERLVKELLRLHHIINEVARACSHCGQCWPCKTAQLAEKYREGIAE